MDTRPIGREKLDAVLEWFREQVAARPDFKAVLWCRFRPEAERLAAELQGVADHVGLLLGGMKPDERDAAVALLHPRTAPPGSVGFVGTVRVGGLGLELSAADTMVHVSNEYSLVARRQSKARILGPNQHRPCSYFDVVAEGPDGQRTVDHQVLAALREKRDLGAVTTREWLAFLTDSVA
jgi:hypothetical protein